jgi:SNF2 family DNA or RNA helicase
MRIEARLDAREECITATVVDPTMGWQEKREVAKLVGAGRWSKVDREWRFPLSTDKCDEMRRVWGPDLKVEKGLGEWYRAAKAERAEQTQLAADQDAELRHDEEYPDLSAFMGADQRVGARWVAGAYRNAGILADEPGLGKTFSVIAGLAERQVHGPILIVCPKVSVRTVWARSLRYWRNAEVYAARGTRAQRERTIEAFTSALHSYEQHQAASDHPVQPRAHVLIVVAEMLRAQGTREGGGKRFELTGYDYPQLHEIPWRAVVLDESHKLLGALTITKGNLMSEGLRRLSKGMAADSLRLAVSGTPFGDGGRVEGMFGTLHWCWPDEFTSFWRWAEDNFNVSEEKIFVKGGRGATKTVKKVGGLRRGRTERQFFESLGPRLLRRTMEEVSPEHEGQREWYEVVCELEPAQAKAYKAFADNAEIEVDGGILSASGVLAEMTRARQLASGVLRMEGTKVKFTGVSGKLDRLMQELEERGLLGPSDPHRRKVVIASQFNEFLEQVCARLDKAGTPYLLMTGATSDTKRDAMMDEFQAFGGPRIFVMNSRAGGVSINLDAADEMHQLDEMWPPEANEQLHRRIFRRSRVHRAVVYRYITEGTIEEAISGDLAVKLHAQLKVLDGRRGRDILREVLRYKGETA